MSLDGESPRESPSTPGPQRAPEDIEATDSRPHGRPNLLRRAIAQPVSSVASAVVPAVVDAVDLNETLARIDIDEIVQRVDADELVGRVDIDRLIDRVDIDRILERVDIDRILDRVDIDQVVARVSIEALLARVDIDSLVARVDIDRIVEGVDIDRLLQRVDIDRIVERIDIAAVAGRIELGSVVTRGTGGLVTSLLDLLRRQVVGLDVLIMRLVDRMRRHRGDKPVGPPQLAPPDARIPAGEVSGRYAGPFSRLLAFAIDTGVVAASFAIGSAVIGYLVQLISGHRLERSNGTGWSIAWLAWWFVYLWVSLAVTGRTVGKGLVGLRVVAADGSAVSQRQAFVRVIAFPLSFLLFGIGFLMILIHRQRRALHDVIAGTCEVYDWGDRPAEMPNPLTQWLSRRGAFEVDRTSGSPSPQAPEQGL